jgi:hypothetical protein
MVSTVRIGMVGAGAVAARHLRALLAMDGVEVAAVADPALERARELAGEAGAAAYPNHMELLAAERLDAVYICVPPFAHGAPELAVIDAGLPMFVEKPVAIDQETAAGIAARLAGTSLVTCTGAGADRDRAAGRGGRAPGPLDGRRRRPAPARPRLRGRRPWRRGPGPGPLARGLPDPPAGLRHHPLGRRGPAVESGEQRWLTGGRCGCW